MKRIGLCVLAFWGCYPEIYSQTWSALGNGVNAGVSCVVPQERLYVGGGFDFSGTPLNGIAAVYGSTIDTLNEGVNGDVFDAAWFNGRLIVGGSFAYAGGPPPWGVPHTDNIASWDSINGWQTITPNGDMDFMVRCLQTYQGSLYVAGSFMNANNQSLRCIARWNGSNWYSVGGGANGAISCMEVYHNQLYIGGIFSIAGGTQAFNIARWNGTQWDSVGSGASAGVYAMVVDSINDVLYVAGGFTSIGGQTAYGIAKWNDTSWTSMASNTDTLWGTKCLTMFNGQLVAGGGNITITAQGDTISNVYTFDGTKWISFHGGADETVLAMCVYSGDLYIGGYFLNVGNGIPANRIACYGTTCPTSVGITEQPPSIPFTLFPNPNKDVLHIESEDPAELIFRLYDATGKLIAEKKFVRQLDYSIEHLPAGAYSVRVSLVDGSRVHNEQLIIK
jgi:trimeric autotransporter adhesin